MLNHVAFIVDGNRRWARERNLPVIMGHDKGYRIIENLVKHGKKLGIKHMTFWVFSTENWNRVPEEVAGLMKLFREILNVKSFDKLIQEGAKVTIFGDMSRFEEDIQVNVKELIEKTADNGTVYVNFALNYGGRADILQAVNRLLDEKKESVDEKTFSSYLYTGDQPDPDLIVRTGGEQRLSGYLPWQGVYSELYFTDTYWPDFDEKAFDVAINAYEKRNRRFGK
jgi:undecaprenyl diphosphate synthase